MNNREVAYRNNQQYQPALQDYEKALQLAIKGNNLGSQAMVWHNIGNIRNDQKKYTEAITAYHTSDKICRDLGIEIGFMYNANGLGGVFLKQKNYIRAQENIELSLEIAQKMGQTKVVKENYQRLAQIYAGLNQYQKAFDFQTKYQNLNDSIFNTESDARFAEMEAKYETEKKEKENQLLKAKNDQAQTQLALQNTKLYASTTGGVLVLLIAGLLQRSRQQQRKLNQKLEEQNQKLVELDEFKKTMTGMIVHDLKNPLNVIIGNSEKPENQIPNQTFRINQSGKRMLNLVQNMLDVQRFEEANIHPQIRDFSLFEISKQALNQVELLIQDKNLTVKNEISKQIFVQADKDLTERVLVNLLTNAIKYSSQNQEVILKSKIQGEHIEIEVQDKGTGIPSDFLPRIFEKFTQVEAKKSGVAHSTGLGLTFCKMATEIQGGKIWVKSEFQKGSSFFFTLAKGKKPESQTEITLEKMSNPTTESLEVLRPYILEMQKYSLFQVSELNKIIRQIPDNSPEITAFKAEIKRAIFSGNQEKFEGLIK